MNNKKELSYKDLKMVCNRDMFHFETTQDLESVNDGIGQERGIKALQFGLQVDVKGYNIYIEGPSGVGKTMYTKNYLDSIAPKKKVPNDWCYIYNFQNPNEPIAVSLPAGQGKEFKESMDGFIQEVKKDIKKTFNADDFEKEKALLKQEFEEKRSNILDKLNIESKSQYTFEDCKFYNVLPFDFYLPQYNILIEYDGIQHFEPIDFAGKGKEWAMNRFIDCVIRDTIKNEYCKKNNIKLIRIPYWDFDNIEEILKLELKQ